MSAVSGFQIEKAMSYAGQFKARLLEDDPEIDREGLFLALDSETPVMDLLRKVIVSAIEDETFEAAIAVRIKNLQERKARYAARADAARGLARDMMTALELNKITETEFTATVGAPRSKAVVVDASLLPEALVKVVRSPDMSAISACIKTGGIPTGVEMQPAPGVFTIRVR